jgi:tetratricopeptide (TPR) repeat protein
LLAIHVTLTIRAVRDKSATFDEKVRLTAGYSYWVTGDYRLDPVEPPLSKLWAALPLVEKHYRFPDLNQPAWWFSDDDMIGSQFFFRLGNDLAAMLFSARAAMALLSVALGLLVYLWSRRLFGDGGALLSLLLYAFCPNMLAHASLVTTEIATCLFFVAASAGLWWVLHRVTAWSVLLSGAALAGLFCSKMSAPLIIGMGLLMLALRLASNEPLTVCFFRSFFVRGRAARLGIWMTVMVLQVLITAGGLWAAHRFRYCGMVDAAASRDRYLVPVDARQLASEWDFVLADSGAVGRIVGFFRKHRLLPEAYLYGVALQAKVIGAEYGFLNGRRRITGWWYFFPCAFLVKTPLGLFGLLAMAAGVAISYQLSAIRSRHLRGAEPSGATCRTGPIGSDSGVQDSGFGIRGPVREASPAARSSAIIAVLIFLAVYWIAAVQAKINIGHRHILPVYPFLYILSGGAALCWRRWPIGRWLIGCFAGLFVVASLRIYPDYLAYFNILAGGPRNGYRHLVDSSLDWGQDLPGLKRWLDAHASGGDSGVPARVYLSYFGTDRPTRFGINATMLPSYDEWQRPELETLRGGIYCISATMLQVMYIMPTNAWTETFESAYQLLRPRFEAPAEPVAALDEEASQFRLLRFARLCSSLRRRRPDDQVHYTILVYRLTDQEVRQILEGPPVELVSDNPVDGGEDQVEWYRRLAEMYARRGQMDQAARHYRMVLDCSSDTRASCSLGQILMTQGDYSSALDVLTKALGHSPDNALLLNTLAWLRATCPIEKFRDAQEAVRLAEHAVRIGGRDLWQLADTLAAAYAEAGRYSDAIHCAQRAEELAAREGRQDQATQIRERADLYRAGKPFREHLPVPSSPAAE